ncbi:MAG: hypothetical protein CMC08_02375 [Flavobacteriaceae bacterium]|nr:hypothetical protein [Flavobacteriaceae bacterium]
MEVVWIVAILIFLVNTYLIWRFSKGYFEREYGKQARNRWVPKLYYWQSVIYISTGLTFLFLFILKWANLLEF